MNNNTSSSIGFSGLLTILFIALKLLGAISWSWFWVMSPLLIPLIIVAFIIVAIVVVSTFIWLLEKFTK